MAEPPRPASHRPLLLIDAAVDLALGVALLAAPAGVVRLLGLPGAGGFFYTTVLGAVLVGIGIALLLSARSLAGLGLAGAVAIDLCGALAVMAWLIAHPSALPLRGRIVLSAVAGTVLALAVAGLAHRPWRRQR